ncbi:hypothetical protein GCM10027184_06010 [Saccharothrix stipae]
MVWETPTTLATSANVTRRAPNVDLPFSVSGRRCTATRCMHNKGRGRSGGEAAPGELSRGR